MVNVINRNNQIILQRILTWFIALVWLANGLFCKVLGLVPRHEQIVARILTPAYGHSFTVLIGISEILMAIWILSSFKTKLNAIVQIVIVATMNTIEFILAPDLLLWGKFNSFFAFIFILVVFINGFYLNKKITQQAPCSHF
ncbi:putative membrane protein YphA (DoxX/SURF4 family) [Pedobacter sp. W3I1]|uniref:DoxX-like family protein n=1 Tax=Pedobacter sp. W3I1 TaxID=3042291 RepID=UPI0027834CD7|nr:DoxX-like family protein [Pedobacter sp. W3I1]MDQ0636443.1 putative membrane protein YphA (DoxX/SURF4 family) [Pedobacter sp. W3I1]